MDYNKDARVNLPSWTIRSPQPRPWARLLDRMGHTPEEGRETTSAVTDLDTPTPSSTRLRSNGQFAVAEGNRQRIGGHVVASHQEAELQGPLPGNDVHGR